MWAGNNSSSIEEEVDEGVDVTKYAVPCVFAIIFLLGVVGNATTIFIVVRNKKMWTTPNIFIVSLACGDLLLLLVSVPFFAMIYTYIDWSHGVHICKLNGFLKEMSLGVSVFTLTALSVDRFRAIMYPISHRSDSLMSRTLIIAGCIWVLAIGLAIFEGTIINVTEFAPDLRICHSHPYHWPDWFPCFRAWFRCTIYFIIPLLIITVLYSLMARTLLRATGSLVASTEPSMAASQQAEARRKVAKLVLIMVILFALCWLPRHIYLLWFHCPSAGFYNMFWHVWKIISYCLCFCNSCINPIALYVLSKQFRDYYNQYLFCGWRKKPEPAEQTVLITFSQNSLSSYRTNMTLCASTST